MKVVFIIRATSYTTPGGDTIQVDRTAKYLRHVGVEVDIKATNMEIDYDHYDLMHFYNIIRPGNILKHIDATDTPFVISPIFVDYSEFDSKHRHDLLGVLSKAFSSDRMEYFKAIGRMVKNEENINSFKYLFKGHKQSIKYILEKAACVLPNSQNEYERLLDNYGVEKDYIIVPNGIDNQLFNKVSINENESRRGVICVARIEGIKNQSNLVKAMKDHKYHLTLIGNPAPNHREYYQHLKEDASVNIEFKPHVPHGALVELYNNAKVHVLPSWFETTGLTSLEAAAMGCNIVVTEKGDTREYYKNYAFYCDPGDPKSIREKIEEAYETPYNPEFNSYIRENFTWEKAAEKTHEAYKKVLNR